MSLVETLWLLVAEGDGRTWQHRNAHLRYLELLRKVSTDIAQGSGMLFWNSALFCFTTIS